MARIVIPLCNRTNRLHEGCGEAWRVAMMSGWSFRRRGEKIQRWGTATFILERRVLCLRLAMRHWKVQPGHRVGVVGIGGLGHMAVKLAKAQSAHVVMFISTQSKLADAPHLGADEAMLETDEVAYSRLASSFDFILTTIPQAFDINPYISNCSRRMAFWSTSVSSLR